MIEMLGRAQDVPVMTRDQVAHAKPDPDLFLAAAERLGVDIAGVGRGGGQRLGPARRAARARARASGCCRAATDRTSSSAPAPTACTRTPRTCSATWTKSASGSLPDPYRDRGAVRSSISHAWSSACHAERRTK